MRRKIRQKATSAAIQARMANARSAKLKHTNTSSVSLPSLPRKRGRPSKKQGVKTDERVFEGFKEEMKDSSLMVQYPEETVFQQLCESDRIERTELTDWPPLSRKERGLSVSLVVGQSGDARIVQEEVEVVVSEPPVKMPHEMTGLMDRVLSTQTHCTPHYPIHSRRSNDSLAFVTNREGYVRVEPLIHGALSPLLPTPMDSDFYMDMKGNDIMNTHSLLSPESHWESSGDDETDEEDIMDARVAMKKLIDKRRTVGLGLDEFLGSDVLNTPFQMGKRRRKLSCKACHMTFRQSWVLHAHEKKM